MRAEAGFLTTAYSLIHLTAGRCKHNRANAPDDGSSGVTSGGLRAETLHPADDFHHKQNKTKQKNLTHCGQRRSYFRTPA